jgi:cysteine desulfurase
MGAREELAGRLGCDPELIVFTSGATEGNNTVIHHLSGSSEGEAWISAVEHPCVNGAVRRCFKGRFREIPVDSKGVLELEWLERELRRVRPAFVGVMAANNETGMLQPWREVMSLCREREVPFFCDAAQWLGKMAPEGLGQADYLVGCAHKFGGPQGVGFMKVPGRIRPLLCGGPQEAGLRPGTENVAGVLSMVAALRDRGALLGSADFLQARLAWRCRFEEALVAALPGTRVLGAASVCGGGVGTGEMDRLWNTVALVFPVSDCRQRWVVRLDRLGFAVSTGSACASGKEKASHVLVAMGLGGEAAGRVIRVSSGWETEWSDWEVLFGACLETARQFELGAGPG